MTLPAIPWQHSTSDFGSIWRWETPHFVVTVNGDQRSCYYAIADKSAAPGGEPRPFADGTTATFADAERAIRTTLGKAYPPALGYQHYAGPLATTFALADGKEVDLGPYAGQNITVTVLNPDGTTAAYQGTARIDHYTLVLSSGKTAIRITPTYIKHIEGEIDPMSGRPRTHTLAAPRLGRTVSGNVGGGCTGRPGFLPNTVEHTGIRCPIHE